MMAWAFWRLSASPPFYHRYIQPLFLGHGPAPPLPDRNTLLPLSRPKSRFSRETAPTGARSLRRS